jgi:hypothetical protein
MAGDGRFYKNEEYGTVRYVNTTCTEDTTLFIIIQGISPILYLLYSSIILISPLILFIFLLLIFYVKEYLKLTPTNHADYTLLPNLIEALNISMMQINEDKRRSINEAKTKYLTSEVNGWHQVINEIEAIFEILFFLTLNRQV